MKFIAVMNKDYIILSIEDSREQAIQWAKTHRMRTAKFCDITDLYDYYPDNGPHVGDKLI